MEQRESGNDRRNIVQTLINPSTFSIVIPLLFAVGSAFMVHDRAINTLLVKIEQIEEIQDNEEEQLVKLNNVRNRLSVLEQISATHKEQHATITRELKTLSDKITSLTARSKYVDQQISDIKGRIARLEAK